MHVPAALGQHTAQCTSRRGWPVGRRALCARALEAHLPWGRREGSGKWEDGERGRGSARARERERSD